MEYKATLEQSRKQLAVVQRLDDGLQAAAERDRLKALNAELVEALDQLLDADVWAYGEGSVCIRESGEPQVAKAVAAVAKSKGEEV